MELMLRYLKNIVHGEITHNPPLDSPFNDSNLPIYPIITKQRFFRTAAGVLCFPKNNVQIKKTAYLTKNAVLITNGF